MNPLQARDLLDAIAKVTAHWTRQRKAEERNSRAEVRRLDAELTYLRGVANETSCADNYRSAMDCIASHIDLHLAKWVARKYKRVHGSLAQAYEWLRRIQSAKPCLFAHWEIWTRRERSTTRAG